MILAPLFAAAIILIAIHAPEVIAWVHALPVLGPFFQRTISPNAAGYLIMLGVFCPAIPAFLAVALYRALLQMWRDVKAQRIRERRKAAWLSRERAVDPTVERLVKRKSGIDNGGKSI